MDLTLAQAADYEGTEAGEYWRALAFLMQSTSCMSDEFRNAFSDELRRVKNEIECHFRVVTKVVTHPLMGKCINRYVQDVDLIYDPPDNTQIERIKISNASC